MIESPTPPIGVSLLNIERPGVPWWQVDSAWDAANMQVDAYICPSSQHKYAEDVLAVAHIFYDGSRYYKFSANVFPDGYGKQLGITNYIGCAGTAGKISSPTAHFRLDAESGIFYNRSKTAVRDITDGTSKTIMFGEVTGMGKTSDDEYTGSPFGWMGCGMMWTTVEPSNEKMPFACFNSEHPEIVQTAFGDGSVHSISFNIERYLFRALGSIGNGEVVQEDDSWR